MAKVLVSWSTAYDNIMKANTNFLDHLADKNMWKINISYIVEDLKKESWWTGLNICYNLALLWTESILLTSVWKDFDFSNFIKENVDLQYINISRDKFTARSYITTDKKDSQITAFYPWAMLDSCDIPFLKDDFVSYSIVSANHIDVMKKHIKLFKESWTKTFFDPGQQITQMTKEDLEYCFKYSDYIILNEYEYEVIKKIAEKTDWEMIEMFEKMILTYWVKGSKIFDRNYNIIEIHWVENPDFVDVTWAWDAYRAWLLKGLTDWYNWETSARIWAVLASLSTGAFWAQNHFIDWKQFSKLYKMTFGEEIN